MGDPAALAPDPMPSAALVDLPELPPAPSLPALDPLPPPHEGQVFYLAGREWVVPPLTLDQARRLDSYIRATATMDPQSAEAVARISNVILVAMQRNYPTLTRAHVEHLMDMGVVNAVFEAVLGQSGYRERGRGLGASP